MARNRHDRVHLRQRRGRRTWEVHFTLDGRRRFHSLGTSDRRVAEDLRVELESKLRRRELRLPRPIPIEPLLEEFLAYKRTRRAASGMRTDEGYLRRALAGMGVEDLTKLQPIDVERYLDGLHAEGKKPKTLNRIREVLHTLCAWAWKKRDYLAENPIARVDRYPEPAPEIRYLPRDKHEPFLQAFRERDPILLSLVATCLFAGLRRGEAIWLRNEDIDLEKGFLRIRAKRDGEQGWQPKTRRNRSVPVSDELRAILKESPLGRGHSEWAFPSPFGCRWDRDNLTARFRRIAKAAGFDVTLLDLRHTFGTLHAMRGASTWIIANWMGNSEQMVRRHYAAFIVEQTSASIGF